MHHVNFLLHKIMSYIFSKMIGKIKTIILQLFFTTFHLVFLFTRAQKLYITRCAVLSKKSKDSQAYIIVGLTSTTLKHIISSQVCLCSAVFINFSQLVEPYHAAKFEKILKVNLEISACRMFGQNCPLNPKEYYSVNFTQVIILYLLCPNMLQSLKKILNADSEI